MPLTPRNIARHELIGLEARVVDSSHKDYIGISGKIVDETRNMLVIFSDGKFKRILKKVSTFHLKLPDGKLVEVEGWRILGRPEDRVKKSPTRRW
ncbi:TPA: ribonuclease P protein component 1 [Candidatus Bathyarchaeota archaeon]|nr:ribonuclease P protein component 1 [Candidatus Bathyarchaeota archaeon]